MDRYLYSSQNYLVPGESSTNIDMPGFQISIKKDYAIKLSNLTIGSKTDSNDTISYGFTFPDVKDVLNESMQQTIVLLNVCQSFDLFFLPLSNNKFYCFKVIMTYIITSILKIKFILFITI